jgi:hypothetical protein
MQCSCGGSSEYEHKVVRDKSVVATYLKCPGCLRVLFTWFAEGWDQERLNDKDSR